MNKLILLLPVAAGVMWGSVGVFVRKLTEFGMNDCTVLSSKMILASIIMFIGIFIYKKSWLKIKLKDLWIFISSGILGMMLLNFCYNWAINQLTLSFAAVLLSLSPVFVMFFVAVLFRERVTLKKVLCTVMAVAGCVLVSGMLESGAELKWTPAGIIVGLLAAVFYALYSVFSKLAMKRGYNVFTITFYSMLTVSIILSPFTQWDKIGNFVAEAPAGNSLFMLLYALCTSVLPYIIYTAALEHADAGKVAILGAGGEPSAAMLFGVIFFGEVPTVLTFVGLVVTIVALAFICMPEKASASKPEDIPASKPEKASAGESENVPAGESEKTPAGEPGDNSAGERKAGPAGKPEEIS